MNKHHEQQELCKTRALYRQGKKLTAVKVYTVNNESSHLYVYGVPKINLRREVKLLFLKYGHVTNVHVVPDLEVEMFTECYHINFERIQSARIAKRFVDNKNFYGGILHVCYTPEHETIEETRKKLHQRNVDVLSRLQGIHENFKQKRNDTPHNSYIDEIETGPTIKPKPTHRRKRLKLK